MSASGTNSTIQGSASLLFSSLLLICSVSQGELMQADLLACKFLPSLCRPCALQRAICSACCLIHPRFLQLILRPWRWRWYVPLTSWLTFTRLHGIFSQKTLNSIFLPVRHNNSEQISVTDFLAGCLYGQDIFWTYIFEAWKWRGHVPLKHRYLLTRQQGATTQRIKSEGRKGSFCHISCSALHNKRWNQFIHIMKVKHII
jgi:hypothetical protein